MFTTLISDIDYNILPYLNAQELCRASLVNKEWNKKALNNEIWKLFFGTLNLPKEISLKSYYNRKGIISINALMEKIAHFSGRTGPHQNGRLICYFPKKCLIEVKLWRHFIRKEKFHINKKIWFFETFPFKSHLSDTITVCKNQSYLIHVRLPKKLMTKNITNRIIDILNTYKPDFSVSLQ